MTERYYTVKEAAAQTGKTQAALRKLSARHGIGIKLGRDWLYTEAELKMLRHWRGSGRPPGAKNRQKTDV